jgi:hypothetical protein
VPADRAKLALALRLRAKINITIKWIAEWLPIGAKTHLSPLETGRLVWWD